MDNNQKSDGHNGGKRPDTTKSRQTSHLELKNVPPDESHPKETPWPTLILGEGLGAIAPPTMEQVLSQAGDGRMHLRVPGEHYPKSAYWRELRHYNLWTPSRAGPKLEPNEVLQTQPTEEKPLSSDPTEEETSLSFPALVCTHGQLTRAGPAILQHQEWVRDGLEHWIEKDGRDLDPL